MREILFRGKRSDNSKWVEGFYVGAIADCSHEICDIDSVTGHRVEVDPATVGQYTGLQDKNGKRIFEGDIVADGNEIFVCFWDGCNVEFGVKNKDLSFGIAYLPIAEYEVIGNIHDNPELMDEGADQA